MKKEHSKLKKHLLAGIMTAVLLLPSLPLMNSCKTGFYYDNAAQYTHGKAEFSANSVEAIDINWFIGGVELLFTEESGAAISVTESANKKTDEETSLHYWLDGTTLKIQYAASGKLNLGSIEKTLKMTVPKDKSFRHISISGESANVKLTDVRVQKLTVSAVSGNIELNGARITDEANISSTSGNIRGRVASACNLIKVKSSSGSIDFSTEAKVKALDVETTSGNVYLSNLNPAKKATVDTVSGNVELEFLDNSGFSLTYDTVNGKLDSKIKMYVDGKKYVYGTPSSEFKVKTASGNLTVTSVPT